MIRFLFKGLIRDKNRSLLPVIIVAMGVALTVFMSGYVRGFMGDMIDITAKFDTGHVKITTRAWADNADQLPNDLALLGVGDLMAGMEQTWPDLDWVRRIKFAGLLDLPDEQGETLRQGPALGLALDLLGPGSSEPRRLNLANALVSGQMPDAPGQALIGTDLAKKLDLTPGRTVTFIGSTMNGSMAFMNYTVAGCLRFGAQSLDNGAVIVDIRDAALMLDMDDGASEILGFLDNDVYEVTRADAVASGFNKRYANDPDTFAPLMVPLRHQGSIAFYFNYVDLYILIFVGVFVMAMSVVLWNTGLLGGLRRYQEFGIRLALGESKAHLFLSLIFEALAIGCIGSVLGTLAGVFCAWLLQVFGLDISGVTANSAIMMPSVIRARVTPSLFYIGFIPGLLAMVLGNVLAGIGVFRRETAQLFKELEV